MKLCRSQLLENLKLIDAYGQPLTFSFKGEHYYKTRLGGFLTVLSGLAVLAYFFMQLSKILQYQNVTRESSQFLTTGNGGYTFSL
mmetsp:Transcript_40984/g.30146  ORF Transcript_40984/g.30146 Transcript_40984/m.30146 type:complete len:85 (+) Transcript_40984:3-257(+)